MRALILVGAAAAWVTGHEVWSVLLVVLTVAVYVAQCVWWPFGHCWCCKGAGRHYKEGKRRRHFRDCWWCKGSGRRIRIARRVWNRFAKIRKAAA